MIKQRPTMVDEGGVAATITQPPLFTKTSKTIQVKDHTVTAGKVSILDSPPSTPSRKWYGVPHDLKSILYLRGDSLTAIYQWLISKGLGKMTKGENRSNIFEPINCYIDLIGDIVIDPATYSHKDPDNIVELTSEVMAGGYHVNVRLL